MNKLLKFKYKVKMGRTKKSALVKYVMPPELGKNIEENTKVEKEDLNTASMPNAVPNIFEPGTGDTVIINAECVNKINFEIRNLETRDGKIMLGKNTVNAINVFETLYNTIVHTIDPDYPQADFLAVYKYKIETSKN